MTQNDKSQVYSCTLATLNALTRKRYESINGDSVDQVEVFEPFENSLEKTIDRCKDALLTGARKIHPSAIVVEARYVPSDKFMPPTMYATGIVVKDCTGQPRF